MKLVSGPVTVKFVPELAVSLPLLVKPPAVVKLAPPVRVKLPLAALVAKFLRILLPPKSMIFAPEPVSVMLAALVTRLVPLAPNCRVPLTEYVPPVRVVPEKLTSAPPADVPICMVSPAATLSVPLLFSPAALGRTISGVLWLAAIVPVFTIPMP